MKSIAQKFKFLKTFFVCFLLLNLTLWVASCSDNSLEESEEITLFNSDKGEEPDPDNRKSNYFFSEKNEETDPSDRY